MTPLLTFNILVMLYGLLETSSNLKLRKRRGVARLAFNDVGLAGLMEELTRTTRVTRPEMALFAQAIFGEVSEET